MPRLELDLTAPPTRVSTIPASENLTGSWRSLVPQLDAKACTGCLLCWKFCPEACVSLGEKPVIDLTHCKGCGICAAECPPKCLTMIAEVPAI